MIAEYLLKGLLIAIATSFLYIIIIFIHGVPVHDFNLWRLDAHYRVVKAYHPEDSEFLIKKKFLGGPYDHGASHCNYIVGEVRSSSLSKQQIESAYSGGSSSSISGFYRIPIQVRFIDDVPWEMISPWSEWWDELYPLFKGATSTIYLVYMSIEGYPYLGDLRCSENLDLFL